MNSNLKCKLCRNKDLFAYTYKMFGALQNSLHFYVIVPNF